MILTPTFGTYPACVELYCAAPLSFGSAGDGHLSSSYYHEQDTTLADLAFS